MKEALTIAMSRLLLVKVLKKLDMIRKNDIERILKNLNHRLQVLVLSNERKEVSSEYAYTLRVDEKSDVYSFGVVLLELITGRRPVGDFGEEGVDIVQWAKVKTNWSKEGVVKILDERSSNVRTFERSDVDVLHCNVICPDIGVIISGGPKSCGGEGGEDGLPATGWEPEKINMIESSVKTMPIILSMSKRGKEKIGDYL
ncbi:hypothetical protein Syun_013857 [Stephania yunnanensis]|uniref:Protein kinase domain-containing protein n=1 Tax=Stephania yunnanensis TaxID=152371 RepID=A0AAP0P835_9MAGN